MSMDEIITDNVAFVAIWFFALIAFVVLITHAVSCQREDQAMLRKLQAQAIEKGLTDIKCGDTHLFIKATTESKP